MAVRSGRVGACRNNDRYLTARCTLGLSATAFSGARACGDPSLGQAVDDVTQNWLARLCVATGSDLPTV